MRDSFLETGTVQHLGGSAVAAVTDADLWQMAASRNLRLDGVVGGPR